MHPLQDIPRSSPALVSFVIPLYNEEQVLPHLRGELEAFLAGFPSPVEIILVDDGSTDGTPMGIHLWAREDPRIKVLGLARNFGHQNATTAGLDAASGEVAVILDADLQDPLELIPEMIAYYRRGYDVVYGWREAREGEGWFKRGSAWVFYRLMRLLVHRNLPIDAGDFRLISRRCLDALLSMRETHRFLRGMVAWVGFPQIGIPYRRRPRVAGVSKYPLIKMLQFALTAVSSFSPLPLRISLAAGLGTAVFGVFYGLYAIWQSLHHNTVRGWTGEIILTSLFGGAILISNGLLGEYIAKIYEEAKDRPLYIVSSRVNFGQKPAGNGQD